MEKPLSKGAVLLADAMKEPPVSQLGLERELKLSRGVVSRWLSGHARPEARLRLALVARFPSVTLGSWDEPAEVASATGTDG